MQQLGTSGNFFRPGAVKACFQIDCTNVNGSGISLGHPLAATGGILTTKLFYELKNRPEVRYAMVTMCIGGGMGFASIFEQCRKEG